MQIISSSQRYLRQSLIWYPRYFTNWILTYFLLSYLTNFKVLNNSTLLLLVNTGSVGGFYITYIHPQRIYVPYFNILLEGFTLQVLDILAHQLPALYTNYLIANGTIIIPRLMWAEYLIMSAFYLSFNNPMTRYAITLLDLIKIVITIVYATWILLALTETK